MDEQSLEKEFFRSAHRIRRLNMGRLFTNISQGEFFVLELILRGETGSKENSGILVSSIARELRISLPAVSRTLRGLEEKKLISRAEAIGDRRNTFVFLTEEGIAEHGRAVEAVEIFHGKVIGRLGEKDTRSLIMLMDKMALIIEEELGGDER